MRSNFVKLLALIIFFSFSTAWTKEFRVAVSRYQISGGVDLEGFLNKLEKEISYASKHKADFILIPELASLDLFDVNPKHVPKEIADSIQVSKKIEKGMQNMAKKYMTNILGASLFVKVDNKILNRAYYIHRDGKVEFQDKIYPTPWESKYNISGGDEPKLFEYEGMHFALLICHDIEFPNISVKLSKLHPEVIFVPSQTDSEEGRNRVIFTSQARAVEQMSYVILTGTTGLKKAKWHTYQGGAHIFYPQNKYFPVGQNRSHFGSGRPVIFKVDPSKIRIARKDRSQVFPARDLSKH